MSEPRRLSDLVETHRAEVHLSEEQKTRGRSRLLAQLGVGTAASALVTGVAARSAGQAMALTLGKVTLGLVLVGAAGAAYYSSRAQPMTATSGPSPSTSPAAPRLATTSEPQTPARLAAPEPPVAALAPSAAAAKFNKPLPAKELTPPAKRGSLADEVRTMQDVDSALRSGNASQALKLLSESKPPETGGLLEERAAARVFALCSSGQIEAGRQAASRFIREWPRSPLAARVKSSCSNPKVSPPPDR